MKTIVLLAAMLSFIASTAQANRCKTTCTGSAAEQRVQHAALNWSCARTAPTMKRIEGPSAGPELAARTSRSVMDVALRLRRFGRRCQGLGRALVDPLAADHPPQWLLPRRRHLL